MDYDYAKRAAERGRLDMSDADTRATALDLARAAKDTEGWGQMPEDWAPPICAGRGPLWVVYTENDHPDGSAIVAITGNGPTSEANARLFVDAKRMVLALLEEQDRLATCLRNAAARHEAELQAAHAAGVAEGKASEGALEMFVVRSLAHEVKDGDDQTAEQLIEMLLAERDKLQMLLDPSRWPRFWVRWYGSMGVGFTLTSPWWLSGWAGDRPILVAAVRAPDAEAAKAIVKASHIDGGDDIEWSFVEARPNDWSPFCDRFPRADWMVWP